METRGLLTLARRDERAYGAGMPSGWRLEGVG